MTFSQRKLQDMVRRGSAWMTARRKAELELVELAKERPETAAREFIVFARMERDRLRQELAGRFGFSVIRERSGFRCRFAAPGRRPKTPEEEATWLDAVVALAGFEVALGGMWLAAAYFPRPRTGRG